MRILLLNPPKEDEFALFVLDDYSTKARSNIPPLGLMYLQSYLNEYHDVKILDMNAEEMSIKKIGEEIDRFKPDIIGITCVIAKWLTVKKLAKEIKEHQEAFLDYKIPIVVGGVNPSLYPYETLQCREIDYVVAGFGQVPFRILCHYLENDCYRDDIPNVFSRDNCDENTQGTFCFSDIDEFPMPDRLSLNPKNYTMPFMPEDPTTSMLTSLGCPYKCSFCACKNFQPVTIRNAENIITEMKEIERIGIRSILFQDELFTMSTNRIKEICSLIISEKINLNWSVRSRANLVNQKALEIMAEAGCFNIHLGIESGTDRILEKMNKKLTIETIKQSVETIKKAGLSCTASFMIGYPDETRDEILKTITFAHSLELNNSQFFITQPEPGTELYEELREITNLPRDIYSNFTLYPESVDLKNNIASTIFIKDELTSFIKFAYTQTNNLYQLKAGENKTI